MRVKILAMLSLLGLLALGAVGQNPPPPPPPAPKPAAQEKAKPAKKAKRVWTDEDVKGVRKPWDEHSEQKIAAEEAAKAAEAKKAEEQAQAKEKPKDELEDMNPELSSPERLEAVLQGIESKIERTKELVEQARRNMTSAANQERYEIYKMEMETHQENIAYLEKRAEEVRGQLEQAKKKAKPGEKPAEKPATPPPPPPAQ